MTDENKLGFVKEVAKDVYSDIGHPVAKPAGELAGLLPRAIKAALEPVEKWVLQREYNVAETKKLLAEKLKNVSPELITPPEPHIAVPALQYISYCMDNEELRNMYANLLANSMNNIVKNGVHPGFVEIIKQMSPDEAKIMRYFKSNRIIPTISVNYVVKGGGSVPIIDSFSDIGYLTNCENPLDSKKYFDNLMRLGLLEKDTLASLTDKSKYEPLKNHPYILQHTNEELFVHGPYEKSDISEGFMRITAYGEAFCSICLDTVKVVTTVQ